MGVGVQGKPSGEGAGRAAGLESLLLFVLAFGLRVLPWPTILAAERVHFFGMDAYYHMRRVLFALYGQGSLAFDSYLNFPHGAEPIWPPFFDVAVAWMLAPIAFLAEGTGAELALERAAAFVPSFLGALCVLVLFLLARRHFDAVTARVAALFLCILPAHFWYSQLGFLDHHAAVALLSTGLLGASMALLSAIERGAGRVPLAAWAGATGALLGVLLLVWPGGLLHVGIVEISLLVFAATRPGPAAAARAARWLALVQAVALAFVLPSALSASWSQWSDYSPAVLSRFQPWMFAALGVQLGAVALLLGDGVTAGRIRRLAASRAGRVGVVVGTGAVLLAASLLALPELWVGAAEAWRWFAKDEVFQDLVKESKPLFMLEGGVSSGEIAELRLSRLVYPLPVVLAWLAWRAHRDGGRPAWALLAFWTLALGLATILQRRFFNSLSPAFALVSACALVEVARALRARSKGRVQGLAAGALVAVAVAWALDPIAAAYKIPAKNWIEWARGVPLTVPKPEIGRRAMTETAAWIRRNTPDPGAFFDAKARPRYGILAPWGFGHIVKYVARRPTMIGNFGDDVGGDNLRLAEAYWKSPEAGAGAALDGLGVRYVIAQTPARAGPRRLEGPEMRKRLAVDDSPDLARHRLVYESPLGPTRQGSGRSEFRVFEVVAGALVVGRAEPGALVRASLDYVSNRGREGRAVSSTRADGSGVYRLRLPYATRGSPPAVRTDEAWQLLSGERGARLVVPEAAVREGTRLVGPDLGAARDGTGAG